MDSLVTLSTNHHQGMLSIAMLGNEPWSTGDQDSLDRAVSLIHYRLRSLARRRLRLEWDCKALQTDELVSELYVRLRAQRPLTILNGGHLMGICARLIGQILIDEARRRQAICNGGGVIFMSINETLPVADRDYVEILGLHRALERLGRLDERKRVVTELRFFLGMTIEETAAAIGRSVALVKRDWDFSHAWLMLELK
jgi:RNA polymerase sigma-70 factor, ECF subfamily